MSDEKKIDDGGQAFPCAGFDGLDRGEGSVDGMSLRDYFAAAALTGMAAKFEEGMAAIIDGPNPSGERLSETAAKFAGMIYATADAMLAARERKGTK